MINKEELRIGNWVNINKEAPVKPEFINTPHRITLNDFQYLQFYSPLPITAEILSECGFDKVGDFDNGSVDFYSDKLGIRIQFSNYTNISHYFVCWLDNPSSPKNQLDIKTSHLHQLQNLYFALTSKELTWNKPTPQP